jgi:hypothetical protein
MVPLVLGHGLAEKLLSPFRAITAHVLMTGPVPARTDGEGSASDGIDTESVDAEAAASIAAPAFGPDSLTPLPVAALPGWDSEHLGELLFDDLSVFRPLVLR